MIKKVTDGVLIGALQGAQGIIGGALIGAVHGYAQQLSDGKHFEAGKESITTQNIQVIKD
jgi:hypothetical protein